jgi:MFS superfamily sulfate permease-like transporter
MWNWIVTNWPYILSALFGVVVVASIIVKMTPTTKDDSVLGKIVSFIDHFSLAKTANDKKLIEIAKETLNPPEK